MRAVGSGESRVIAWEALAHLERRVLAPCKGSGRVYGASLRIPCGVERPATNEIPVLVVDCSTAGTVDRTQGAECTEGVDT